MFSAHIPIPKKGDLKKCENYRTTDITHQLTGRFS